MAKTASASRKKKPVTFTASQVDQLRCLFAEYREMYRTTPTKPRSVDLVIEDMKRCENIPRAFFKKRTAKSLNNTLWRFSCGSTPETETLQIILRFLETKKADGTEIFDDEDDEEARFVHGAMANGSVAARRVFEAIRDGNFVASVPSSPDESVVLHFTCDRTEMIVWVEERVHPGDARHGRAQPPSKYALGAVRRGYGFLSTEKYLLHVFLVGDHARDRVHYVQFGHLVSDGNPYMLRVGGRETREINTHPLKDQLRQFDVWRFKHYKPHEQDSAVLPWSTPQVHRNFMEWRGPVPGLAWGVLPGGPLSAPDRWERELIAAAKNNSYQNTLYALSKGADPNFQDEDGMTALHHAAARGARIAVRILVASENCDYLIADNKGRYASDLAIRWGHDFGVARLLEKWRMWQAEAEGVTSRKYWRIA